MINLYTAIHMLIDPINTGWENPIPLIYAFQNAPRIEKPYAVLRIDNIAMPGHLIRLPVLETGYQVYGGWRRATVELQVYGRNAGLRARRYALELQSNASVARAQLLNVSIGNRLFLSEVPELVNRSQYEERGIYQFELYFTEELDEEVGLVEEVVIESKPIPIDPSKPIDPSNPIYPTDPNYPPNHPDYPYCKVKIKTSPPKTPPAPGQHSFVF